MHLFNYSTYNKLLNKLNIKEFSMSDNKEISIKAEIPIQGELSQKGAFSGDMQAFENAQRMAAALTSSTIVPKDYQGQKNIGNAMIALEMAQRCNANPVAVMQNLHIIHGKPSWSSQFVIAALNGCGRFSPLRFEIQGEGDGLSCKAWAYDVATNDKLEGPLVSIQMAKAEGWYNKNGSKWKTMPDLMIRYRSAKFFGNLYAPDILMGMSDEHEQRDIYSNQVKERAVNENAQTFQPAQEFKPETAQGESTEQQPTIVDNEEF